MVQICSLLDVLAVFFREPARIHFIKEISREIKLAHTSVRNHIRRLENEGLIIKKESKPFDGYVANRENEKFIHFKQSYNFLSVYELKSCLVESLHPKAIIVFGSYSRGEDIEESDIDLLIVSKVQKSIALDKFEKKLGRKINLAFVKNLNALNKNVRDNVLNGWVIYGGI